MIKSIKLMFLYFISQLPKQALDNPTEQNLGILFNNFFLSQQDIQKIQEIYKIEKKEEITLKQIVTLIKIYYYLCYFLSYAEVKELLTEPIPAELIEQWKDHVTFTNTLVLLWNKNILYRIIGDMATSDENNLKERKKPDFFWQYIIVSGKYTNHIPQRSDFTFLMQSNFTPEAKLALLKKKYGLKDVRITFNTFQEWDRKNLIDKKNKTFSIVIHKSKMHTNIRYELIIYQFAEVQQAVDGFQVIQNNSAISTEQIPNLMKHKNLECKMMRTSIYSQDAGTDSGLIVILNNLPINQYSIIDNSPYVIYIINKSYCEENQETKEERRILLTEQYIENILKKLDNNSLKGVFEKLDEILYE